MKSRGETFYNKQEDLPRDLPVSLAIVPVNTRPITPLPEERKQAFMEHLRAVIAIEKEQSEVPADELVTPYSVPPPADPPPTASQDRTLGLACAVCRGHCCRQGVEHAFQDPPSMRRIRATWPDWDDAEIVDEYAKRLPDESYEDSCIFHTEAGCNLPREMRSDMCNRWMCTGQHRWLEVLPEEGIAIAYVVATPDYEPQAVRSALVATGVGKNSAASIRDDLDS